MQLMPPTATTSMIMATTTTITTGAPTPTPAPTFTPGFVLSWETVVVAVELLAALSTSIWLIYRQTTRDRQTGVSTGSSSKTSRHATSRLARSHTLLLTQPQPWWSLDALLGFRLAAVVFYASVQLYDMYRTRLLCLLFYTSWNFIAQGVYFGVAAARTLRVRRAEQRSQSGYTALLDDDNESASDGGMPSAAAGVARVQRTKRCAPSWLRLELVLDVCLAAALLISAVVWLVLYPYAVKVHMPEKILNWVSYCQHAANVAILQIDFACSRHVVSMRALPLLVTWLGGYTVFTWVLHGTVAPGFWPYPFLDPTAPYALLWYPGMLVAHIVGFLAVFGVSKWRRSSDEGGRATPAEVPYSNYVEEDEDEGSSVAV